MTLHEGTYTWDDMRRWSIVALGVDMTINQRKESE